MKTLLITALLLTGLSAARADEFQASAAPAEARGGFVTRYTLDSFRIASNSLRFTGRSDVVGGQVEIDESARELRLTLNRHLNCPRGVMCIQMVEPPVVLTLPLQEERSDSCGVITIVAERGLEPADGGLTRVEIVDPNGRGLCAGNADSISFERRVHVTLTEAGLQQDRAVTEMTGLPAKR